MLNLASKEFHQTTDINLKDKYQSSLTIRKR